MGQDELSLQVLCQSVLRPTTDVHHLCHSSVQRRVGRATLEGHGRPYLVLAAQAVFVFRLLTDHTSFAMSISIQRLLFALWYMTAG
jgi:hypothetical protein